ncbi:wax ester/triacylglycerol synthase domain-containing protein [Allokutzneria albata]|uniref:Wax ester synthase-like Acyl-CoA acyltransferase domain-containing protein n=1 Tax=Allokutzneria albata TaxID=211114 RepID=A0A1G9U256_ALLAB|nr:wax ester/triacylglycerol synthase domain-containing protein [Allokutzneria albata]SDM54097.1 Wax ester synthase-like Acyl-CoA acyltransferase domain-containing protein [Allokutzneria albata]
MSFHAAGMDRVFWEVSASSVMTRPYIGLFVRFAGRSPGVDRFRRHVTERLAGVPALAVELDVQSWRWKPVGSVDLVEHVRSRTAPGGLDAAVQDLLRESLPESGPLWRMWLVADYAADEFAVLLRVHHALMDAGAMLRAMEVLFTERTPTAAESSATYHGFAGARPPGARERVEAAMMAASVARASKAWVRPAQRSSERSFQWAAVPRDRVRELARRHGASTNDVFLAGLALALSQWSAAHGGSVHDSDSVPFVVPAGVRATEEADEPGNRTAFTGVAVPGRGDTAAHRLPGTTLATKLLKSAPHRLALRHNLDWIPGGILRLGQSIASQPERVTPVASHVVLRHELSFDGVPATYVQPVMFCLDRFPLAVLCLTYRGTMTACFTTDPALPGLEHVHQRWQQALGV